MPYDTPTPNGPDGTLQVRTAFLVVQHENGEWEAMTDFGTPITAEHPATVIEMKFGASEVVSDIEASKQAAITAHQLMAVTAQMQQAASHRSLADQLKL
ncbi:hypothetical protein [Streptomyces sp. NBC_01451]|uniref:hypothetical protein n=1 Tax=Streptomyces sp. NBC_01451 TaxID=2903872 RepID=UPI002E3633DA|nr:hypothetical protein [Streptomyces sp. NBC_01451]